MDTKMCCSCRQNKNKKEFNKKTANKDGLQRECRECHKQRNHNYYINNKLRYKEQAKQFKQDFKKWFIEYKSSCMCERCGEKNTGDLLFITKIQMKKH